MRENPAFEFIKSIVVIPLTVAIVLGLGWGLVNLAAREQVKSGKPDPEPAEKKADGVIAPHIEFTEVRGDSGYWRGHHGPSQTNWQHEPTYVAWHFRIETAGHYTVEIEYACDPADAGSKISVQFAGAAHDATVASTGGWKKFETLKVGDFDVSAPGWQDVRITPVSMTRDTVMNLRGVRSSRSESRPRRIKWFDGDCLALQYHFRLSTTVAGVLPATKRRMFSSSVSRWRSAMCVEAAATWGVMIAFGIAHSGESTGSGSVSKTSSAAPAIRPACRAATRSASTTIAPRPMLMKYAVGFIASNLSRRNSL